MFARLIPLPVHGALELVTGFALLTLPFALGLSDGALVAGVVLGLALMTIALGAALGGRDGIAHVAAHLGLDRLIIGLLVLAGLVAAFGGHQLAGGVFLAAAGAQLALMATTRYAATR